MISLNKKECSVLRFDVWSGNGHTRAATLTAVATTTQIADKLGDSLWQRHSSHGVALIEHLSERNWESLRLLWSQG